jgi:hypothetical protein
VGGGVVASRFVDPDYQVQSTIFIPSSTGTQTNRGPIEQDQVFTPQGWIGLLRTYAIADSVVLSSRSTSSPRGAPTRRSSARSSSTAGRALLPGRVHARVDRARAGRCATRSAPCARKGIVGDSIGRRAGFAWAPNKALLGERTIKFRVRQPREVSNDILSQRCRWGSPRART